MQFQTHTRILLITALTTLTLMLGLNLAVDPYNVLGTGMLKYTFQPSERFLKIKHLEQRPGYYDAYLLGSSRVGTTHPGVVQKYLPGSHFYNLSVSIGTPYDHLQHLNYLLASRNRPRTLYVELDVDLGLTEFSHDQSYLLTKLHPDVYGQNRASYWLEFASIFQPRVMSEKIWKNLVSREQEAEGFLFLDMEAGTWSRPLQNARIAADPMRYIREEPSFHQHNSRTIRNIKGKQYLGAVREIRDICRRHNIRLIVFTTPHHRVIMDSLVEKDYLDWLGKLAEITPFWDFSGYNSITLNDQNYLESNHHMPHVGAMIAARIFDDARARIPADFGILVTPANVKSHLASLQRQIRLHDANSFRHAESSR